MSTTLAFVKHHSVFVLLLVTAASGFAGEPGQHVSRDGDEIVAAGQFFHTGTKVVLWMDPGGYDAYRAERRFAPMAQANWEDTRLHIGRPKTPNRYDIRDDTLTDAQLERIRGGGWDLGTLQSVVDEFVVHYDVDGVSKGCFNSLQDVRDLSVHFMLDLDGTIYQTLDLKERARHASGANNRAIGLEIANVGSYTNAAKTPLETWYKKDAHGRVYIVIPAHFGPHPERTPNFVGHPARRDLIAGEIQGVKRYQYDYTPQQYEALAKLTATLCIMFPKINCDYPREPDGKLMAHRFAPPTFKAYQGVLGHYNLETDKEDPGPALQWDYVIDEARRLMQLPPVKNVNGEAVPAPVKLIIDN